MITTKRKYSHAQPAVHAETDGYPKPSVSVPIINTERTILPENVDLILNKTEIGSEVLTSVKNCLYLCNGQTPGG